MNEQESSKREYTVTWSIDVLADDPVAAADEAETYMRQTGARSYEVVQMAGVGNPPSPLGPWLIDLDEPARERVVSMGAAFSRPLSHAEIVAITDKVMAYLEGEAEWR